MNHIEHIAGFRTLGRAKLYFQTWLPHSPKAILLLAHGYGEHSSRYAHVAKYLNHAGYGLISYDQRGHGKTGSGTHIDSWSELTDDLAAVLHSAQSEHPHTPIFLYGHSMGCAVLASYVLQQKPAVRGLIFSSGLLQVPSNVSPLLVKMSAFIGALLPKLPTLKVSSATLSHDPAVVAAYDADPLVYHGGIPARTGAELNKAVQFVYDHAHEMTLPLYIWHGTADTLTEPAGSQHLFDAASSADKTLKLYENGFHEMHNEPNKDEVLANLVAWLNAQLKANR